MPQKTPWEKRMAVVQVDGVRERDPLDTSLLQFRLRDDTGRYRVKGEDVGNYDLPAFNYYRNSYVWWVVALINNVVNPLSDYEAGQLLEMPSPSDVWDLVHVGIDR